MSHQATLQDQRKIKLFHVFPSQGLGFHLQGLMLAQLCPLGVASEYRAIPKKDSATPGTS